MLKKPRGTQDLFYESKDEFDLVANYCEYVVSRRNYRKIETPIFEDIKVFSRGNDTSDLVQKELFDFKDKSERHISLKPEGTAPVMRAVIENKLLSKEILPLKFFYISPFFRYERPQSGRQREFHQFGIEKIGIQNIYDQFEGLIIAHEISSGLGLKNYSIKVNYIGNVDTRKKWTIELKKYFSHHKDELSADSVDRINKNPLRILDDKVDGKKEFVINAPTIDKFLSNDDKKIIKKFLELLKIHKIDYVFDKTLVRGLDYYSGIVFELVSNAQILQGQSTLIGGGAYEGIIPEISNEKDHNSFGFALGIERFVLALKAQNYSFPKNKIDIYLANLSEETLDEIAAIYRMLCINGYKVDTLFDVFKLTKHFKKAEIENAKLIIIYGKVEQKNGTIKIRNQKTRQEIEIPVENLLLEISKILKE